ncbi:GIY-YIG nuclease family protein [Ktedonospora formicarum]|uniref:GIY-YIG nuclease family protein n=1 Tax=Ktedonospora formicarum TaxID=2778364 RepID=UPI001C68FB62|nr:GIY-YIG nuclease family protein [Ktedonospora formicarum]
MSHALADDKEEARKQREGLEFYLLWQYRLEFGSSTRCNHGRFHARYTKSTDRKRNIRGQRLPNDALDNLASKSSMPPLQPQASPHENNWMGLRWSTPKELRGTNLQNEDTSPGVYKIFDPNTLEILYVGETTDLKSRLKTHAAKNWQCQSPHFSFVRLSHDIQKHQLRERESDLLGGFYALTSTLPKFQLIDHKK